MMHDTMSNTLPFIVKRKPHWHDWWSIIGTATEINQIFIWLGLEKIYVSRNILFKLYGSNSSSSHHFILINKICWSPLSSLSFLVRLVQLKYLLYSAFKMNKFQCRGIQIWNNYCRRIMQVVRLNSIVYFYNNYKQTIQWYFQTYTFLLSCRKPCSVRRMLNVESDMICDGKNKNIWHRFISTFH